MKKALIITAAIAVIILIGATVAVRLYLTDARIKALVIPPAEKALGRKVEISDISVSLFSGIKIRDLTVAEADNKNVFVHIDAFILKYRLLPLLRKKIAIDRIILKKPQIHINRDRKGKFNFSSLALLTAGTKEASTAEAGPPGKNGPPPAVSVDRIAIEDGRLFLNDRTGEIPTTEINCDIGLNLELKGETPRFKGEGNILVKSSYGAIHPELKLKINFDQDQLQSLCDLALDGQKIKLTATVKDYQTAPVIDFLLESNQLNLDKLAGLSTKLPPAENGAETTDKTTRAAAVAAPPQLPPIKGRIRIARAIYQDLRINNINADLHSDNDKIILDRLNLQTAGGDVRGKVTLTLSATPAYKGNAAIKNISIAALRKGLRQSGGGIADGEANIEATFSGHGTAWPRLADQLTSRGTYNLTRARISRNPYTELLAMVLKDPGLAELSADDIKGAFEVKKGRLFLSGRLTAKEISLKTNGSIGLAATDLDFPVKVLLPAKTAAKISPEIRKIMADDQGRVELTLKVGGIAEKPKITLDKKMLKKAAGTRVKKRATDEAAKLINKELGNKPGADLVRGAADSLLNGLFGGK